MVDFLFADGVPSASSPWLSDRQSSWSRPVIDAASRRSASIERSLPFQTPLPPTTAAPWRTSQTPDQIYATLTRPSRHRKQIRPEERRASRFADTDEEKLCRPSASSLSSASEVSQVVKMRLTFSSNFKGQVTPICDLQRLLSAIPAAW